jgi:hypothetical protein
LPDFINTSLDLNRAKDDPRGALRWSLSKIRQIAGENCVRADRNTVFEPDQFDCFHMLGYLSTE